MGVDLKTVEDVFSDGFVGSCVPLGFKLSLDKVAALPLIECASKLQIEVKMLDINRRHRLLTAVAASATIVIGTEYIHSLSSVESKSDRCHLSSL